MAADGNLAATEIGTGPPLLLINGYAAGKADWDPAFIDALARSSTVICPDNPGIGGSPTPTEPLSIAAIATEMLALLDAHGLEVADVAGWSMGGFVAQELAARAPDRIGRLVLLSTDPGGPSAIRASPEVWSRLIDHGGTPTEQATRLLGLLFPPTFAAQLGAEVVEVVAAARTTLSEETLTMQEAAIDSWHREPADTRLVAVTAPTLIAAGTADEVIPAANSTLLAEALAGSQVELYEGCGHAFMAQQPERLARSMADWLER